MCLDRVKMHLAKVSFSSPLVRCFLCASAELRYVELRVFFLLSLLLFTTFPLCISGIRGPRWATRLPVLIHDVGVLSIAAELLPSSLCTTTGCTEVRFFSEPATKSVVSISSPPFPLARFHHCLSSIYVLSLAVLNSNCCHFLIDLWPLGSFQNPRLN